MSAKEREAKVKESIADFHSRIEGLRRDGLRYEESTSGFVPWAYAPENLKLEQIVGRRSRPTIVDGKWMHVPGTVVLEVVERDVDYSKLSEIQRNFLEELRANLSRVAKLACTQTGSSTMALEHLVETWWIEEDQRHDAE